MSEMDVSYLLNAGMQGTGMLLQGSAFAVKGAIQLIQFLYKLHQKKQLTKGEFNNITKLIKAADGNVEYLNIPAENESYIAEIREDLRKMNVPFHVLPDLNTGDGMVQIIYHGKYKNVIQPWLENYCTSRLQEGLQMDSKTLSALAGGEHKTGIITVPTEDPDSLRIMMEEFSAMGVSFTLMPDANAGDGTREVMYAKQDEEKVKSWLEHFCQNEIAHGGEKTYEEIQALAGNKAQVGFINIPSEALAAMEEMKKDFKLLGINYHKMPVQAGSGQTQVMYLKKDEVAVRNWYAAYATDELTKGGRKSYEELMALTNSKVQIVSIPDDKEMLKDMVADFESLHINYTFLPDLNAADDMKQVMYAAADASRVTAWYQLYQEKILKETGEILPEMKEMDMRQYSTTAGMTGEEYVSSFGDASTYEEVKKNVPLNENPRYKHLEAQPNLERITVNKKMVVSIDEQSFISRVPYQKDMYLACRADNVFASDINKETGEVNTYVAFIAKGKLNVVLDSEGKMIGTKTAEELFSSYENVARDFTKVQDIVKTGAAKPAAPSM